MSDNLGVMFDSMMERWSQQQEIPFMDMALSFIVACILAVYILAVYKYITKRGFYSPNFAKTLVGLPVITTAIVFAMQVNVLVSLGMVGALSIVRFRNAVKDSLDLLFLFWSISIGIVCGTSVYSIAVFASLILTVMLLAVDLIPSRNRIYILVVNASADTTEAAIMEELAYHCTYEMVRTRTCKPDSLDLLIEVKTKEGAELVKDVAAVAGVKNVSLVAHDGEVRY